MEFPVTALRREAGFFSSFPALSETGGGGTWLWAGRTRGQRSWRRSSHPFWNLSKPSVVLAVGAVRGWRGASGGTGSALLVPFAIVAAPGAAGGGILLPANLGAVALPMVILLGLLLHRPVAMIPENTLKFVVGVPPCVFGTFWVSTGTGLPWPGGESAVRRARQGP